MPSHVALKLAHEMQKCTIMNNEQLTSFGLFNVGLLCLYSIYRTERRHGMLFKQQLRHMYCRIGTPSVCFVIDVGDVKRLKHNLMLPTGQRIHLQSL